MISFFHNVGKALIDTLSAFGAVWVFLFKIIYRFFTPPIYFSLIVRQIYVIGVESISVVALVAAFTGAVLAVQGEYTLSQYGATASTGSAVALSLLRELGPVLTALMVNGRAGSAMTAELGIMKITEQVDALKAMGVDPLRYLMVPRIVAGIIAVPLLTEIFNVVGILGGHVVGVYTLNLAEGTFWSHMISSVKTMDVVSGTIKAFFFGLCISWVACYKGWTCGFGAVGVNRATTSSVVTASVVILVINYFIASILTQVFM